MNRQPPAWVDTTIYPFANKYIEIDGQTMHYVDEGQGETVVFVHGTPSWSFEWRHLIKELSTSFHCIAPDHIGFGLSDKPKEYNYTSAQHAQNLEAFILKMGLKNITLIVHDFGGPIGLSYAIKYPENIKQLVIFNSWLWDSRAMESYKKNIGILKSPLVPFLYKYLNFSARYAIPMSFGNKNLLTKNMHQMYIKPFGSSVERLGTLGFVKSLLNEQPWFESLWQQAGTISNKPTLFIWGIADAFITEDYLHVFKQKFTNSTAIQLPGVGHFPQEEAVDRVGEAVNGFLQQ